MRVSADLRKRAALVLAVGFAVASNMRFPVKRLLGDPDYVGTDVAVEHERRLADVSEALPQRGQVGYLTDLPRNVRRASCELYLTQYVLAPVLVEPGSTPVLVLLNLHEGEGLPKPDTGGMILVEDFGDGVLLFRHRVEEKGEEE